MLNTEGYFDAKFNDAERMLLRVRILVATGISPLAFADDVLEPAEQEIRAALGYWPAPERLRDWRLIHAAKQLGIDYKSFALNEPKLPLDDFIAAAQRALPDLLPGNGTLAKSVNGHRVWCAFVDWVNANCPCGNERHTFCRDRFEPVDRHLIAAKIQKYNETRPKLFVVPKN
jgi:hypothetical protein